MKKVITSIISLVTITSLLVGAPKKDIVDTAVEPIQPIKPKKLQILINLKTLYY